MSDYQFGEAFCLMWYACDCGHRERFWNGRDGVTPFGTSCPSCGGIMNHVQWQRDVCTPDHVPHHGQAVWRDGTVEDAVAIMTKRLDSCVGTKYKPDAKRRTALIEMVRRGYAEEFQKGWPMLERAP